MCKKIRSCFLPSSMLELEWMERSSGCVILNGEVAIFSVNSERLYFKMTFTGSWNARRSRCWHHFAWMVLQKVCSKQYLISTFRFDIHEKYLCFAVWYRDQRARLMDLLTSIVKFRRLKHLISENSSLSRSPSSSGWASPWNMKNK